ncbi:S-crystallin, Maleylacetoacetate isomerase [Artemisia annua]|uniref:S-crystallin, Maleylacetoacetate isomerase n=1 Tax=Artemisia annua TaxID=35608 RepID=A0A2U1L5C9_ARTAN|nr:S-crystallin, Maleylacetoacetate isomerase [Artemisia annua]
MVVRLDTLVRYTSNENNHSESDVTLYSEEENTRGLYVHWVGITAEGEEGLTEEEISYIYKNMLFYILRRDRVFFGMYMKMQLYSSYLSTPSFTIRIALTLKGLDYEHKSVNLFKKEQFSPVYSPFLQNVEFLKINPMGYVPAIIDGDIVLADSFAILLYLEEMYPRHPLIPCDLAKRIVNYQAASIVTSSMQPLLRIPVMFYIEEKAGLDEKISWVHYYLGKCFAALETLLKDHAGKYATGDEIMLADVYLAPFLIGYPQQYNFDMSKFPLLSSLGDAYIKVPAIENAMPEKQPDFPIN